MGVNNKSANNLNDSSPHYPYPMPMQPKQRFTAVSITFVTSPRYIPAMVLMTKKNINMYGINLYFFMILLEAQPSLCQKLAQ